MGNETSTQNQRLGWTTSLRRRVMNLEFVPLIISALLAGGTLLFIGLADEVMEGSTRRFDEQLLLALRSGADNLADPIGPNWMEEMMRDFTGLGGIGVLTLFTVSVVIYLILNNRSQGALFVGIVVVGGALLSLLLKESFARPRPDLVPHGSYVLTASFPSGHSMLSTTTYLTVGALLARLLPQRRLKIFVLVLAVVVSLLVGVSRVYLGVHWPTDVLAGWTAGATWASACWLVAHWLQERGRVEGDTELVDQDDRGNGGQYRR